MKAIIRDIRGLDAIDNDQTYIIVGAAAASLMDEPHVDIKPGMRRKRTAKGTRGML